MKRFLILAVLAVGLAGCHQVTVTGDAHTALTTSATMAYGAFDRTKDNTDIPSDVRTYLKLNWTQWRWFVRAANRDVTWAAELAPQE